MNISFHGAARSVTGSKHLVATENHKILLDCGMFQGMGHNTHELNSNWGFEPASIDYVLISHAHIDHIGLLPKLVKDGFKGKIFCTPATADLARLLLEDSARIQESETRHTNKIREKEGKEPVVSFYGEDDVAKTFEHLETVPYNMTRTVAKNIEFMFSDCGHVLGSAAINLKITEQDKETKIAFSGDVGRYHDIILREPQTFPQADIIIMESTYGNKLHDVLHSPAETLLKEIEYTCLQKKGKLIIPAFSVGRTQELLFLLNRLEMERRLPEVPYYVDSPLSIDATQIIKEHYECFNQHVIELMKKEDDLFHVKGMEDIKLKEDSIAMMHRTEPCVIISASGMAESGRVRHHIASAIGQPENTIMLSGYCEPESLGGKLKNGDKHVYIYGDGFDVKADIRQMESLSAHGDYDDLLHWLSCQNPDEVQQIFLVHGEQNVQTDFRERILRKGFKDVQIPALHQQFTIATPVHATTD